MGAGGDFVTSPHVHPVFATLLARALRELHRALGEPAPFRVVEAGAGDGTLARALLAELGDLPLRYAATEVSPGARRELEAVPGIESAGDTVEGPFDVLVANELLDNLPFKVFRDGRELGVGLDRRGQLVEVALGAAEPPPPGEDVVVPEGALAFVDAIAAAIGTDPGYALLIDYGAGGWPSGAAHGYAQHRLVEDLLADPGRTDITAGVDFALVRERAGVRGLTAFPTVTQRAALLALGFDAWITERALRPGRAPRPRRGDRGGPDLVGAEPGQPPRGPRGARSVPVAAARHAGAPGAPLARRGEHPRGLTLRSTGP